MDIQISETDLFLPTSKFTNQETVKQIVVSVKGITAAEVKSANNNLATKEDLHKVKEDIQNVRAEIKASEHTYQPGFILLVWYNFWPLPEQPYLFLLTCCK